MRLSILLTASAALVLGSGCNTADLSYPPLGDSGSASDVEVNEACLDRCTGFDSGADSTADAADADAGPSTDSPSETATDAATDANDAGD